MGLFTKIKSLFTRPVQIKNFSGQEVLIRSKNSGKIDLDRKLIVPENFICFLVAKETVCDRFVSGEHKLSIGNLPVLTRKLKLNVPSKKGKYKNKFFADIYFLNLNEILDCDFQSEQGIYIKKDKEFLGLTCFVKGKYSFKLSDPELFLEAILKVYGLVNSGLAERQIGLWTGELVDKKIEKNKPNVLQINERDSVCFENLIDYLNKNTKDIGVEYTKVEVLETILPKKIYRKTKLAYTEQTETTNYNLEPQLLQEKVEPISNEIVQADNETLTTLKEPKEVLTDGISFFDDIKDFDSSSDELKIEQIGSQIVEKNNIELIENEKNNLEQNIDLQDKRQNNSQETLEELQAKVSYKKCPKCGAINSKDAEKCFECKQEFKKICQHCGAEITNGDFVCPKCKSVVI